MRRSPLLVSAAILLCAGCSGGDTRPAAEVSASAKAKVAAPAAVVRAAVAATSRSTVRIDQEIKIGDATKMYALGITGSFDLARDRGRLSVDFPGGAISHMDEIFADGNIYVQGGIKDIGDGWGSMDREKAEVHTLLRAPLNDPEHVLRQVAAMRQVSKSGEEKVNGTPTVHYRGTVDHATLTLRMAKSTREKLEEARDLLGSDFPVYADAWVDAKGQVVRTRLFFSMGTEGSVTATMTLSDFGKPVKATAPPAAEVVPLRAAGGVLPG